MLELLDDSVSAVVVIPIITIVVGLGIRVLVVAVSPGGIPAARAERRLAEVCSVWVDAFLVAFGLLLAKAVDLAVLNRRPDLDDGFYAAYSDRMLEVVMGVFGLTVAAVFVAVAVAVPVTAERFWRHVVPHVAGGTLLVAVVLWTRLAEIPV